MKPKSDKMAFAIQSENIFQMRNNLSERDLCLGERPEPQITTMKAYIDGKQVAFSSTNTLNASVSKPVGSHKLTVNAWDSVGKLYQAICTFNVH